MKLIIEADGGSRGNPGPAAYGCLVKDAQTNEVLFKETKDSFIVGFKSFRTNYPDLNFQELMKNVQLFRERMYGVLQFEEFNASDQNQIDDFKDYFKDSDIYKYRNLYKPESVIACAKSHFTLWQKCVELNEPILILEDDAVFYDDAAVDIFKRTDFNALDFDIFYLDGKLVKDPYVVQEAYEFHSGVAYIIKPEAARKVINKVQEFGFSRALDWELIIMRSHGLKLKSFNNIVIVPKEGEKSDIKI